MVALASGPILTPAPRTRRAGLAQQERIVAIVRAAPGLLVGELQQRAQIGWGTLCHHLPRLVEAGRIRVVRVGRRRLVYPIEARGAAEASCADAILRGKTARRIAEAIHARPGSSVSGVAFEAGESERATYYHVRRLIQVGLVTSGSATRLKDLRPAPGLAARLEAEAAAAAPASAPLAAPQAIQPRLAVGAS